MAYRFTEKRKTVQEAMAYVAYIIVGSYFNKEICRNQLAADHLYLYYKEQGTNKQEMMEACIIAQAGKILKRYEDILSVMNCESRIRVKSGKYLIDFLTGFERVHAEVDQRGKCEIWLVEK